MHPRRVLRAVDIRHNRRFSLGIATEQLHRGLPRGGQAVRIREHSVHRQVIIHRPIGIVGWQHTAESVSQRNGVALAVFGQKLDLLPQLIRSAKAVQHRGRQRDLVQRLRQMSAQKL